MAGPHSPAGADSEPHGDPFSKEPSALAAADIYFFSFSWATIFFKNFEIFADS